MPAKDGYVVPIHFGGVVDWETTKRIFGMFDPIGPATERKGIGKCKGLAGGVAGGFKCTSDADCLDTFGGGFCWMGGKNKNASPSEPR